MDKPASDFTVQISLALRVETSKSSNHRSLRSVLVCLSMIQPYFFYSQQTVIIETGTKHRDLTVIIDFYC